MPAASKKQHTRQDIYPSNVPFNDGTLMNHANKPIGLDLDAVSRILVYAFGAFDRYYICWQDKAGKFHQGKPPALAAVAAC